MNIKRDPETGNLFVEGEAHVDTWDENGVHHSWNIPNSFEPDLPFEERFSKWKAAHPEYDNFGDLDYAKEMWEKFVKSRDNESMH